MKYFTTMTVIPVFENCLCLVLKVHSQFGMVSAVGYLFHGIYFEKCFLTSSVKEGQRLPDGGHMNHLSTWVVFFKYFFFFKNTFYRREVL